MEVLKLSYLFVLTLFLTSCDQVGMSPEQLASEKSAIEDQIQKLLSGYSEKDIEAIISVFSKSGDLAVAVFEAPAEMVFDGQTYQSFFRSARTFEKENDSWLIVQSLSATASEGQSSAELVDQMEETEVE